ncbi:MAG: hypothetical protein ACLPVJ_11000, partial [Syntrophobacteraceae bacterium]
GSWTVNSSIPQFFNPVNPANPVNPEPLAELNKTVTPVTSAVQWTLKNLDSGLRRNDVEGLLQEALLSKFFLPLRALRVFLGERTRKTLIVI